ncbi:MAG: hypothetical protein H0T84_09685 [Tatlockia sp.]|nr:hypothetical protein [Tatlockia sp.]
MTFNELLSFIFINSKINTILFSLTSSTVARYHPEYVTMGIEDAKETKAIYKKQIRRYLGFGFFLSFIPGTEPFLARNALLSSITKLESLEYIVGEKILLPVFHSNIFFRTLFSILYHNLNTDFSTILLNRDTRFVGLNRLNPFLYPTKLFTFLLDLNINSLSRLFHGIQNLPLILKIPVYSALFIPVSIIAISLITALLLYFATELVLNSLHTLLVEPFIFAYEVLYQLIESWGLDLAYMPTTDYKQVNRLVTAIDDQLINDAKQNDNLHINLTNDLTLIESTEKVINSMEKHRNSFFLRLNKDHNLETLGDKTIKNSYNQLEFLRKFSYFTYIEMANVFPKELTQNILDTWLKLNSKDMYNHAIGLNFVEPIQLEQKDSEHEEYEAANDDNPFAYNGF